MICKIKHLTNKQADSQLILRFSSSQKFANLILSPSYTRVELVPNLWGLLDGNDFQRRGEGEGHRILS